MKNEKKITVALLIVYLLVLSWIILFKLQFSFSALDHIREINLIPFGGSVIANGKVDFDEIINNAIVFIPVGAYFSLLFNKSALKAIGSVFGISFVYEIIQFIFAIGASDITDLITNTTGVLVGVGLYYLLKKIFKEKTNKIILALAAIVTILFVSLIVIILINN